MAYESFKKSRLKFSIEEEEISFSSLQFIFELGNLVQKLEFGIDLVISSAIFHGFILGFVPSGLPKRLKIFLLILGGVHPKILVHLSKYMDKKELHEMRITLQRNDDSIIYLDTSLQPLIDKFRLQEKNNNIKVDIIMGIPLQ